MADPSAQMQKPLTHITLPGGEVPGTGGKPAFTLFRPSQRRIPVMIAAPHGGREYSSRLHANLRNPGESAHRLEDRHVDLLAHEVARACGASLLVAHAPRALIDLNRGMEDMDWTMLRAPDRPASRMHPGRSQAGPTRRATSGLGLVPRRLALTGELWKEPLALGDMEERIALVHRPYHATLRQELMDIRQHWGTALLIDLHSMPPLQRAGGAAHYVIGDRFGASCADDLVSFALAWLSVGGHPTAHNRPYAGGYVLDRHAAPSQGAHALQIEVCRSLYLDSRHFSLSGGMKEVAGVLAGLVSGLATEMGSSNGGLPSAIAAE